MIPFDSIILHTNEAIKILALGFLMHFDKKKYNLSSMNKKKLQTDKMKRLTGWLTFCKQVVKKLANSKLFPIKTFDYIQIYIDRIAILPQGFFCQLFILQ